MMGVASGAAVEELADAEGDGATTDIETLVGREVEGVEEEGHRVLQGAVGGESPHDGAESVSTLSVVQDLRYLSALLRCITSTSYVTVRIAMSWHLSFLTEFSVY